MDMLNESRPRKRRRISENEDGIWMIKRVREFQLPQRSPNMMQRVNTVIVNERNGKGRINMEHSSTPALVIPESPEISNVQRRIPCKLQRLRILAPDGRDLGEFNLELRTDNLLKGHKLMISKSRDLKPIEKYSPSKTFPSIPKHNTVKRIEYNSINKISYNKIKIQHEQQILPTDGMLMNNQDVEASKQVSDNVKVLISANSANPESFGHQTVDSNNGNLVYNIRNNVKNGFRIRETRTESNKSFPGMNVPLSRICDSLFPIESHNNFSIKSRDNCNDYLKMSATYSKGKCIATIKNTKGGKIITSLTAINFAQRCHKTTKNCSVNRSDANNKNSLNYQEVSNDRNNLPRDKLDLVLKNDQVRRLKLQKNVMTVIPDSENRLPRPINTTVTRECNTSILSASDKNVDTVNHSSKITCSDDNVTTSDNTQNKRVSYKTCENKDTYLPHALCNYVTECYTPDQQRTMDTDKNKFQSNIQRDKDPSGDSLHKNFLKRLSIISKAMDNIKDEELRELALQALADCGIGIEKYVPIQLPQKYKTVHDTQVQTSVFSLLDPKSFVSINRDISGIRRIDNITLHDLSDGPFGSPFTLPNDAPPAAREPASKSPDVIDQENDFDIDSFINQIYENSVFKETLPVPRTRCTRIVEQLESDLKRARQYDQNGRLGIHNAVLSDNSSLVQRQLVVLKLCKGNIDIPTQNGETSLELAIKYDVSSEIVNLLLEAGAQPVLPEHTRESALIISSKQSSSLLSMLIGRVSNSRLLDQIDSEGFAALHYCSMRGNLQGVKALLSAGATMDLKDMKSGRTALFHAIDNSHILVAQALLQAGANVNIPNFAGQTPLFMTEMRNWKQNHSETDQLLAE